MSSWYEAGILKDGRLELPLPPLQSVTWVKYLDAAGVEQTWSSANYTVTAPAGDFAQRGYIQPVTGQSFPGGGWTWEGQTYPWFSAWGKPDQIKVRFVCGYGATPASVPALF